MSVVGYSDRPQTPQLTAFEYTPDPNSKSENLLIFINGLFGGLSTTSYTATISNSLPPNWNLAEVLLSSSYLGWGASSISKDVQELSQCVSYFRGVKTGRIVLMGHSTGCQDVMQYLTGPGHESRPAINGGIIQAPASDREWIEMAMPSEVLKESCKIAKAMVDSGDGEEILSTKVTHGFLAPAPITARRWLSLASPDHNGGDDYFSSDLSDEQLVQTFGALPPATPLCILFSGNDEYLPKSIDQHASLRRWLEIAKRGKGKVDEEHSGIIEAATHDLGNNPDEVVGELVRRVLGFLTKLPA